MRCFLVLLTAAISIFGPSELVGSSSCDASSDAFDRFQAEIRGVIGAPHLERAEVAVRAFRANHGTCTESDRRAVDSEGLNRLFRSLDSAIFYSARREFASELEGVLDELERRGQATTEHYRKLIRSMILIRDLDAARVVASRRTDAIDEQIPTVVESTSSAGTGPLIWTLRGGNQALSQETLDLGKPNLILVVSHPECHFTQDAVRSIESDRELRRLLEEHSVWIAPPSGKLDLASIGEWNIQHPRFRLSIAVRASEWAPVDSWGTPTFYFFQNGILLRKIAGWPKSGRREEILEAAATLRLLK